MLNRKRITLFIVFVVCILVLYSSQKTHTVDSSENKASMLDEYESSESVHEEITGYEEILEDSTYYKVSLINSQYYCSFYNKNHQVVRVDGPFSEIPHLVVTDNGNSIIVRLTLQAGTGVGTQYGYFYDVEKTLFSEVFQSILDQSENLVAYIDKEKVVVRDIFDKTKYDKEISDFRDPFSNVAQPITNASFSEDSKTITVTYLTGDNFREVSETFEI